MTINIYLHINNREETMKLPIMPSEFECGTAYKNNSKSTVNNGDIRLIGNKELKTLSLKSFFPSVDQIYKTDFKKVEQLKGRQIPKDDKKMLIVGFDYVQLLEEWMKRQVPIRVIVKQSYYEVVNLPMSIDSFTYGIKDGSGDIYYTIQLTEFPFVQLKKEKVIDSA